MSALPQKNFAQKLVEMSCDPITRAIGSLGMFDHNFFCGVHRYLGSKKIVVQRHAILFGAQSH